MALQIISLKKVPLPLYNQYSSNVNFETNVRFITDTIFRKIKETPELVAMLDTLIVDHFLGPVDFFDSNGRMLGPTKQKQVQSFWDIQNVQGEAFYGQALDLFVDGSSFGWHANANTILDSKQKETISKIKALNPEIGTFMEEQANLPRKVSYLAASTITIKNDESGILYFIQDAGGKRVRWDLDQVVHIKLMDFNGEVRGFSPLKALIKEIVMMYMLKENIQAQLQNGGTMDHIISLVGANGTSKQRFERLRTALESFSHLPKSHGNMPIDAEIQVHPIGTSLKDMEYRELAMFIISEFALALGLPTSRIPFLGTGAGGPSNKGELSGNSEDSYQIKIAARRAQFENGWNRVFRKSGFTFRFRRDNLTDNVRETQALTQRAAYCAATQDFLNKINKKLTTQAALELISGTKTNFTEEDIEDGMLVIQMDSSGQPAGIGGEMQPGNTNLMSKSGQDVSANKQKTASNQNKTDKYKIS